LKGYTDKDAFGHALQAFSQGETSFSIIEREDGYYDLESVQSYFAGFTDWPAHQREAMRYVSGRVLDVGCGAGRHALYLQEKGFPVLGIDESPLAIRVCRSRGLRQTRVIRITQIPTTMGTFDSILMLGNNLGLLAGYKRGRWLLRRFRRLTSDRGRIIAETLNPYATQNPFHKRYRRLNRSRGRMPGQVRLRLHYQGYATRWFDYLLVSPGELKRLVAGTGWHITDFIQSGGPAYVAILDKTGPSTR
jgi:SAM-dependent methyltransferase